VSGMAGHKHRRWRLSGKKHAVDHVRNDINVTPLVDVMLVLLIIFMLMVLLMGRGYEGLSLPKASNFSQEKDHMQPVVSLDVEGNLYYEKTRLGPINPTVLKEMGSLIKAAWDAPKDPAGKDRIYIKADAQTPYEKVYPLLLFLNKEMGAQGIDLAIARDATGGK
jgi:biopolymer transport protein ExbD